MKKASWFSVVSTACAALAVAALLVSPAGAALSSPLLSSPGQGESVQALPVFAWQAVAGADHYEFELSADGGFNSTLAYVSTRNLRGTVKTVVPNGTYYWHVRAVTSAGSPGPWSQTRTLTMAWTARPSLLEPSDGDTINYPIEPFKLSWTPVPGASKYSVRVATDPALGSLAPGWTKPVETAATSFTLAAPLAPGTYYWDITPLNAEGHAGKSSDPARFEWVWPTDMDPDPSVSDLVSETEVDDFSFSWGLVPGAAGYEVEVNFDDEFDEASKVCCEPLRAGARISTLGTSLTPRIALANNTYYWRVRPVDASGNAGEWNVGPSFTKTFASVPPVTGTSVKNLRLVDTSFATVGTGSATSVPIIDWDPVPGASRYFVDVTTFKVDHCDWSEGSSKHWERFTTTTAWTPLGAKLSATKPWWKDNNSVQPSSDGFTDLVSGQPYCIRVTPIDGAADGLQSFSGDATYLPANNVPAFTWVAPSPSGSCTPCSFQDDDYLRPVTGQTVGEMPVFTWKPIPGALSYYVLVARDPNFTTYVDFAFTQLPAYAPRTNFTSKGYADETTQYYWAVLPARGMFGTDVSAEPLTSDYQSFLKQTPPPTLLGPTADEIVREPATVFRWTPVLGARRYRLEVSQQSSFAKVLDTIPVVTDSTAYTSNTTYPSDTILYWRVRAEAENGFAFVPLTWSATGTFRKQLPRPVADPDPAGGAAIPTWTWSPVPGAVSYDMHAVEPDGDHDNFGNLPSHAFTATKMTGVGVFSWQVRANFPASLGGVVSGPYTTLVPFARTIPEPKTPTTSAGAGFVALQWQPVIGAKQYRVQVSTREDFSTWVENTMTQTTNYAPPLNFGYTTGGSFYWRVAAIDADLNQGDFTVPHTFYVAPSSTTITKTATTLTAAVAKTSTRVKVAGALSPSLPGKVIAVTLYRKRSGVYRAVATKRPVLNSLSRYATSFARPRPGYCRVTARFAGDATHKASAKTVNFRC